MEINVILQISWDVLHLSWPQLYVTLLTPCSRLNFYQLLSCKHYTDRFQRPQPDPCSPDTSCLTSMPLFYFLTFLAAIPWIVSATKTRSSALSNSTLNSLDNASSTRAKSSGLRTEPWCTPTLTLKAFSSLHSRFRHCILMHCFFTNTIHSSTLSSLSEHQLNHLLGHHFKRFIRINKGHPQNWSSFFARYFSCSWRNINIASVKRPPCHKYERHVVNFTFLLPLLSIILYKSFIACYNNFIPMYEPQANTSSLSL